MIYFIYYLFISAVLMQNCLHVFIQHTLRESFSDSCQINRNQNVFTIFRLIWNQTDVRLVPNQSEYGEYNLILG